MVPTKESTEMDFLSVELEREVVASRVSSAEIPFESGGGEERGERKVSCDAYDEGEE